MPRIVNGNSFTENGWPMAAEDETEWVTVPGVDVHLQIQQGVPAQILGALAADFHAYVEPLRDADSASWTRSNDVLGTPGRNNGSNHLGGTAMDLNWDSHPFHVRGTFNTAQQATIRELEEFYEGTIFWAGRWDDPVDEMHWQMGYDTYNNMPKCVDFIERKISSDGFSSFRRSASGGDLVPRPEAPPAGAADVLFAAVPVIDEARAAHLAPLVAAGLRASNCNTPQRIAMWLAQVGHESDGFATTEEYAKNGRYAPYIGRTWIQITWESNYRSFGQWAAGQGLIDDPVAFVNNPTSLADERWAGLGAAWYWTVARPQISAMCDAGDMLGVTRAINGGTNGLDDRQKRYTQAIALGDALLALIGTNTTPQEDGPLMALSDAEQQELLHKVRMIFDQLCGIDGAGWPQLGSDPAAIKALEDRKATGAPMYPVDAIAWMLHHVSTHKSPTP